MRIIDLDSWHRKEHFYYFLDMDDPYTGVVVNVDCTRAKQRAKELGTSFWLYYMHKSLTAAIRTEPLRYRIDEQKRVVCLDTLYAGTTIDNPAGSYSIAVLPYHEDYDTFVRESTAKMARIRAVPGINFTEEAKSAENILYSTVPQLSFTMLKHATYHNSGESRPKITFGGCFEQNGRWLMPVSVEVHHALMDGGDIAEHIALFQQLLDE